MAQLVRTWQRAKPSKMSGDACPSGSFTSLSGPRRNVAKIEPGLTFQASRKAVEPYHQPLATSHWPFLLLGTLADDPKVGGYDLNNPVERRREYGLVR